MQIASAGMTVLFIVWAYYQRNDVDPILWVSIYAIAALCCALFIFNKLPLWLPAALGAGCTIWAVYLFFQPEYDGSALIYIEEWREAIGLLVIGLWMGVMIIYRRKLSNP